MKIYAARQPIFDSYGKIFGYEFLYRDSEQNVFNRDMDGSVATSLLLSNIISEFGLENLTGGAFAFLNLTEQLLRSSFMNMIDPKRFIIEILEDVDDNIHLNKQLAHYRDRGYIFALDDYAGDYTKDSLVDVVDILKVDFRQAGKKELKSIVRRFGGKKQLLAEKIETQEEKDWAVNNGFSLLQGYYFSKPVLLSRAKTEIALATYMRLLKEFSRPDTDFGRLANIILMDVNLSYKFLVRMNTLRYYRGYRVNTVKQSLIRMGLLEVKRWTLAILIRDVFAQRDNESAKRALIRGTFTEKLTELLNWDELVEESYMVGMFSCIDTSVRDSLEELLLQLKTTDQARAALFQRSGRLGEALGFVENYENGRWDELNGFLEKYNLKDVGISFLYFEAVKYAELMFEDTGDLPAIMGNHVPDPLADIMNQQRMMKKKD